MDAREQLLLEGAPFDGADLERLANTRRHYIFSRLDLEAMQGIAAYRRGIGISPIPPKVPGPLSEIGAWLDSLVPWQWFVTGTFRPQVRRTPGARGFAQVEHRVRDYGQVSSLRGIGRSDLELVLASQSPRPAYVRGFFDRFVKTLERENSSRADYYVGFEAGPLSGANHFHALLHQDGLEGVLRSAWWQWLHKHAGRSLILPFDPGRGAGWYLAQAYVGKRPLGWDIRVGNRPLIRHRPARGGGRDVVQSPSLPKDLYHCTLSRRHR